MNDENVVYVKEYDHKQRNNRVWGRIMELAEKLNVRAEVNKNYANTFKDICLKYTDNEIDIFFKEAPVQFKSMPKPVEVREYFENSILKSTRKNVTVKHESTGCNACKFLGYVLYTNGKSTAAFRCDCSLGSSYINIPHHSKAVQYGYNEKTLW